MSNLLGRWRNKKYPKSFQKVVNSGDKTGKLASARGNNNSNLYPNKFQCTNMSFRYFAVLLKDKA